MKHLLILLVLLYTSVVSEAQTDEPLQDVFTLNTGGYTFKGDTANLFTVLDITKDGKQVFKGNFTRVVYIKTADLDDDGINEILIDNYTGDEHCCYETHIMTLKGNRLSVQDTILWGDSYYELKDLNTDGNLELTGFSPGLGYAFTNFVESRFPLRIVGYKDGKTYEANSEFPQIIRNDAAELVSKLEAYLTEKKFECPKDTDAKTYDTPAGAVKAYLAAITIGYNSIGETAKGYELIEKYYECSDKQQFIETLRRDYNVK